mmetsp:Transcript_29803/g.83984  ORF Transcript_29803/g.83984 Transcript_29803/m.83984 type:complete len:277 (-) Transcript_29803:31-861(-)
MREVLLQQIGQRPALALLVRDVALQQRGAIRNLYQEAVRPILATKADRRWGSWSVMGLQVGQHGDLWLRIRRLQDLVEVAHHKVLNRELLSLNDGILDILPLLLFRRPSCLPALIVTTEEHQEAGLRALHDLLLLCVKQERGHILIGDDGTHLCPCVIVSRRHLPVEGLHQLIGPHSKLLPQLVHVEAEVCLSEGQRAAGDPRGSIGRGPSENWPCAMLPAEGGTGVWRAHGVLGPCYAKASPAFPLSGTPASQSDELAIERVASNAARRVQREDR